MSVWAAVLVAANVYQLPISAPGLVEASKGYTQLPQGRSVEASAIAEAARGMRFVFVGESHDNAEHHRAQAEVIEALVADGRRVSVGLEMFTFDNQANLNPWAQGMWSEEEFIQRSDWKNQWGFDYTLYKPIFDSVRTHRLGLFALNVPRPWVSSVSRTGMDAMTDEMKQRVPRMDMNLTAHRTLFNAMMEGHPPGAALDGMYRGMVMWDEGMAANALAVMRRRPSSKDVMVILAGNGHIMHGTGINRRIEMSTGESVITVVCIEGDADATVSKGLGQFVYRP
ncbi:MAG: ChaN family lipoprotein [Fimbriimonadaceae bacterium]|nr:ChaN family lipoprotein [Fimbriimonadaceae bacterium]